MNRKLRLAQLLLISASGLLLTIVMWTTLGARSTVLAQGGSPTATPTTAGQTTTHVVQAGETLSLIAKTYGVTVAELVVLNAIQDPDLIEVGQVLVIARPPSPAESTEPITHTVQAGETLAVLARQYDTTVAELVTLNGIQDPDVIEVGQVLAVGAPRGTMPSSAPAVAGGPLSLTWSLVDWRPSDPDYVAALSIQAQGGVPPYTFYHDGLVQAGAFFEFAWRRCTPKPGSVGVADASGASVTEGYWFLAPYCPVGVEVVDPAEGARLTHDLRHFNITWQDTVDPPPPAYGIEIEVWERGEWRPWQQYVHKRDGDRNLFFVPDVFPGDLGGRVRMWGIYGEHQARSKTDWRTFEFRTTP